jgi:hypothetical protein
MQLLLTGNVDLSFPDVSISRIHRSLPLVLEQILFNYTPFINTKATSVALSPQAKYTD